MSACIVCVYYSLLGMAMWLWNYIFNIFWNVLKQIYVTFGGIHVTVWRTLFNYELQIVTNKLNVHQNHTVRLLKYVLLGKKNWKFMLTFILFYFILNGFSSFV